jgi:hypothetical protein
VRAGATRSAWVAALAAGAHASSAHAAGPGIEWGDCTDVMSGGAGIGLFLIHMADCRLSSETVGQLHELGAR